MLDSSCLGMSGSTAYSSSAEVEPFPNVSGAAENMRLWSFLTMIFLCDEIL